MERRAVFRALSVPPPGAGEPSVRVRPAAARDRSFVEELSREAFSRFGPYHRLLPPLLERQAVEALVAESSGEPIGFVMVHLAPPPELMAVAVIRPWRRRGVGRLLLEHAERIARPTAGTLRLSVAADNAAARRLFEESGYVAEPQENGLYPRGQISLGMAKDLSSDGNNRTGL